MAGLPSVAETEEGASIVMALRFWQVEAFALGKELSTGRTKPLVCDCKGSQMVIDEGNGWKTEANCYNDAFVVKFTGWADMDSRSPLKNSAFI